jgi:hypothetical protein
VLTAAAGAALLYRSRDGLATQYPAPGAAAAVTITLALAPVVVWTAFVAWRGTFLPVYSHDGLAYHLPKAVLLAKASGFHVFDVPEARIATWPCNYELLLADTLALTGGDSATASIATVTYATFIVMTAWIAASWWGPGVHAAIAAAAAGAAPLVVLHSGLHKNDLLAGLLAVASFAWAARWYARGCRAALALATVAVLLMAGTKATSIFPAVAIFVVVVLGARRHRPSGRDVGVYVAASLVATALLGGAAYAANLVVLHRPIGQSYSQVGYGDWSTIWQFTAMLVLAPFSRNPGAVWNPFRGQYWWWIGNDVWTSHYGAVFSVCTAVLALCVWRYCRRAPSAAAAADVEERAAASLAPLAAYVFTLPLVFRPRGLFCGETRYVLFVIPFVFAWTLCPLLIELFDRAERAGNALRVGAQIAVGAAMGAFGAVSIWQFGVEDPYAPLDWVIYAFHHPEDRLPFVRRDRAASAFDVLAGPNDVCAIDVANDTWVYPAFGRDFTRKVEFLKPTAGAVAIPDDAQWVLVDRSWNVFFGHPKFVDMGLAARYLGRGKPSDDDLKIYRQLGEDPRFELVYDERRYNQAVFHRRKQAAPAVTP